MLINALHVYLSLIRYDRGNVTTMTSSLTSVKCETMRKCKDIQGETNSHKLVKLTKISYDANI